MKENFDNETKKHIDVISLRIVRDSTFLLEDGPVLNKSDAIRIMANQIGNHDKEVFAILCLDAKGNPTCYSMVHIGTLNQALVHPREIFKIAILSNANAIILGHNHPSGDLEPSASDVSTTKNIVKAGAILGIEVCDHVIVSGNKGLSMRERDDMLFKCVGGK